MPSLHDKLNSALNSREARHIRRRLPPPTSPSDDPNEPENSIDFTSNDYLSLSSSQTLRDLFLSKLRAAPDVLGSGGSRLLVNGKAHARLESRLSTFFRAPAALLFNSGFDANVSFFSCVPQPRDFIVYDEYIHASVHDGIRASRTAPIARRPFSHNSVSSIKEVLSTLRDSHACLRSGDDSVFVAVESLYSMDGTFAPLQDIVDLLKEFFPLGNGYLVVDEAHATGIYGPQGRGVVAMLGLEDRVLARLHTFGKALAATGAVIITNTVIRDYLLNYARSLIYTTSLSFSNIIAADCSFDMLENGQTEILATKLLNLSSHLHDTLKSRLPGIPSHLLSLPSHLQTLPTSQPPLASPIIPIMTSQPRPLSSFLRGRGINARPITWPTVPKGKDRVRVCLHAGNSKEEIDLLVDAMVEWARGVMKTAKL